MKRVVSLFAISVTFVVSACSQRLPEHYQRLIRPDDTEFYHTPVGLCEDYPEESTTSEIIRRDLELLSRSGTDVLRISFGWDGIEGSKDEYDWLFWDEFVETAVDEFGITLIPYICYTPLWNSTTDDIDDSWHFPPKDYDEFGEFVHDLVSRYSARIKSWEIWNEPDIWIFWAGDHEQFARLLKQGSDAVRRADPGAQVVMGGLAHDTEWLETLFRDYDVSPLVDVVNMHNYFETWSGKPLEEISDYVNTVHDIVNTYGDGQPLWMAEVGYSTYRDGPTVSDSYSAYYSYEHTPRYQGVDLFRRLVRVLSTEKLSAIAWYEIKDLREGEDTIGDFGNNGNLGVASNAHVAKPAERALTFFHQLFSEPVRSLDDALEVAPPGPSNAYVHAFEETSGDVIVIGWLATLFEGRGDPGNGDHADDRVEAVSVRVPRALAGPASLYDEAGNERDFEALQRTESTTTVDLELRGGEISIIRITK